MQGRPNKLDKGSQRFRQQFGFQLGVTKVKPKKKPISIQQYPGLQVMTPGDFETYSASAQWINRFIGPSQDIAQAVNTIMRKTITNVPTAELNKASKAYLGAHMTRYRESVSALEIGDLTVGSFPGKEKFVFGEKGWEPIIIQGHKAGTRTTYFNSQVLEEKLKEGRMYDIVGVAEPPESFYPGENDGELTFEYLGMTKKELEQKEKEFERKLPGYMTPGEKTQLWNVTKDHMYTDDFGDYLEGLDGSHFTNNQKRCIDIFKALTTIEAQLKKAQKDMIADTIPRLFRNIYEVTNQNGILIAHNSLACETDFTLIHEGANHTLYQKQ